MVFSFEVAGKKYTEFLKDFLFLKLPKDLALLIWDQLVDEYIDDDADKIAQAKVDELLKKIIAGYEALKKNCPSKLAHDIFLQNWEDVDFADVHAVENAFENIDDFIYKRRMVRFGGSDLRHTKEGSIRFPGSQYLVDAALRSMTPNRILGMGASAQVYEYVLDSGVCVKAIYEQGDNHSIHKELSIMDHVNGLTIDGASIPHVYYAFSGIDSAVMVMERVYEPNCSEVVRGEKDLPAKFHAPTFFNKLTALINAMHEKGVFHLDMFLRNIMIDERTGDPHIIDFGKGALARDVMGENQDRLVDGYTLKDLQGLRRARAELMRWLGK